jgi:hypothetical protein
VESNGGTTKFEGEMVNGAFEYALVTMRLSQPGLNMSKLSFDGIFT